VKPIFCKEGEKSYPKKREKLKKKWDRIFYGFLSETSQYEKSRKTPISKTQQVIHAESVFVELELAIEITTSSKSLHG
jgi:hypothetical protein